MRVLIIGFGSIGQRHFRVLKEMGAEVAVVSKRILPIGPLFAQLTQALTQFAPNYVIVCNQTSEHWQTLQELEQAQYSSPVLVEKPLCASLPCFTAGPDEIFHFPCFVGYNLRFHPLFEALKNEMQGQKVFSVHVYCGQYLPDWRKADLQRGYHEMYSAKKKEGGGVLRDLSHELDYLWWLLGPIQKVIALGGKYSSLQIDSDDTWSILMETTSKAMINLTLNYLDRKGRREIIINADEKTIRADLITHQLEVNELKTHFSIERDDTYRSMHQHLLSGQWNDLCSLKTGLMVVDLIEKIEKAREEGQWQQIVYAPSVQEVDQRV